MLVLVHNIIITKLHCVTLYCVHVIYVCNESISNKNNIDIYDSERCCDNVTESK